MASLTDVFVAVKPDLDPSGFERDLKRKLDRVDSRRAGMSVGQNLGKGMKVSLFQSFGDVGKGLTGAFAGLAAIKVFGGFIEDARESAKVGRLTEQVIKTTGAAAGITADEVGKLATSISNKTGIDDEQIQSAENLLLCLEQSAQALTRDRGWVTHEDLCVGDEILAYDPADDTSRWEPILDFYRYQVDTELIHWKSKQIDVKTTPHHRWWTVGQNDKARYTPQFSTTEEISGKQIRVKIGGGLGEGFAPEPIWSDELVELAGWVITEGTAGWVRPSTPLSNQVSLTQSETANPEKVKQIHGLMDRLRSQGHRIGEGSAVMPYNGSTMRTWWFARDLGATLRAMLPDKKLSMRLVTSLTREQAGMLLAVLIDGDGHIDKHGHRQYIQKDRGQLDLLAAMCAMLGIRTTDVPSRSTAGSLYLNTTNHAYGNRLNAQRVRYSGVVWCPQIRTGIFMARNKGRTFWTGNTFTNVRNEVGKGNDIFNQASQAAVDMSVALGTDSSAAAIQLGKALNDPIKGITALSKAGVSFTAQQKAQIKTLVESGHTLEAQKIILAELNKEFGGAAEAAADPLDKLKVIAGNLGETVGGLLLPVVERVAQLFAILAPKIDAVVGIISSLPGPVKAAALTIGGLAFAVKLLAPLTVIPGKLAEGFAQLVEVGGEVEVTGGKVSGAGSRIGAAFKGALLSVSPLTVAIGAAAIIVGIYAKKKADAASVVNDFTEAIKADSGALGENTRALVSQRLEQQGALRAAQVFSLNLADVTNAALGNQDALSRVNAVLDIYERSQVEAATAGDVNNATSKEADEAYRTLKDSISGANGQINEATGAAQRQTEATKPATAAIKDQGVAAVATKLSIEDLTTKLFALVGVNASAATTDIAFRDSLNRLTESVKTNGATLSIATQKGRDNRSAIIASIEAAQRHAEAVGKQTGKENDARRAFENSIPQIREQAKRLGLNRAQVDYLISSIAKLKPKTVAVKAVVSVVDGTVNLGGGRRQLSSNPDVRRAAGGPVPGYSPSDRSDNVPIRATAGEWVIQKPTVRKLERARPGIMAAINAGEVDIGGDPDTMRIAVGRPVDQRPRYAFGGRISGGLGYQARSLQSHLMRGGRLFEDFSYPGMSAGYARRNDDLAAAFYRSHRGFDFGRPGTSYAVRFWLGRVISEAIRQIQGRGHRRGYAIGRRLGFATGGLIGRAQNYLKAQAGEPYIWGGTGPFGGDCSGYVGNAYNILTGRPVNSRAFTTATIGAAQGFRPGKGTFTVGVTRGAGHMAGNLAGLKFEATPPRLRTGASAAAVTSFARQFYLPQIGGVFNGNPGLTAAQKRSVFRQLRPEITRQIIRELKVADRGGVLMPGQAAVNASSRPEMLRSAPEEDALLAELRGLRADLARMPSGVGREVGVTIAKFGQGGRR